MRGWSHTRCCLQAFIPELFPKIYARCDANRTDEFNLKLAFLTPHHRYKNYLDSIQLFLLCLKS